MTYKEALAKIMRRTRKLRDHRLWQGCLVGRSPQMRLRIGPARPGSSPRVSVLRVVYRATHGKIPEGKIIVRTCDHPACVAPEHLVAVKTNESTHGNKKAAKKVRALTNDQVRMVRRSGEPIPKLAEKWGVSTDCLYRCRRGITYKHVK